MATLKRPKAFQPSTKTLTVSVEGSDFEIANLLKSGIMHQNIILFDFHDVWHEIEILNFGLDNSDLQAFKNHIEQFELTLVDIGIKQPEKEMVYGMTYEDHVKIANEFPRYTYVQVGMLHKHFQDSHRKTFFADLRDFVKMCDARGESIEDFIKRSEEDKNKIINSKTIKEMKDLKTERIEELVTLGATEESGTYSAFGIIVSPEMIESLPDVAWKSIVDGIKQIAPKTATAAEPVTETVAEEAEEDLTDVRIQQIQGAGYKYDQEKGWFGKLGFPVVKMEDLENLDEEAWQAVLARTPKVEAAEQSAPTTQAAPAGERAAASQPESKPAASRPPIKLETFAALTPDRIAELAGLKEKQETVVAENPFIKVTDAKTLKAAKTAKSNLLKASTSTEKIETDATKYLNTFKNMLKGVISPLAKITREAHEKQATEIKAYEEAEELKAQEAQKAKLAKIKQRTETLFTIPMTFDGSMYGIGTFYIMPTQIETADDAEFAELVKQAQAAKAEIDAAAEAESKKDEALMAAAEQLSKFNGKSKEQNYVELIGGTWTEPAAPSTPETVEKAAEMIDEVIPAETPETPAATTTAAAQPAPETKKDITSATPASIRFQPAREYIEADPDDDGLQKFDLDHLDVLQKDDTKAAMIIRREYFKFGRKTLAQEIDKIFQSDSKTKAQDIKDLIAIIQR